MTELEKVDPFLEARKAEATVIERCAADNFDWENPYGPQYRTPAEHILAGSTAPGQAFRINEPIALHANRTLEEVNQMREQVTEMPTYVMIPSIPDRPVFVELRLLPLTEDQLNSETYQKTFEVVSIDHDAPVEKLLAEVEEYIKNRIQNIQARNQNEYLMKPNSSI